MIALRPEIIEVVSFNDPAIDPAMPAKVRDEYIATRDINLIKPYYLPGEHPQVFVLREIPQDMFDSYVGDSWDSSTGRRALRAGLVRIKRMRQPDGTQLERDFEPSKVNGYDYATEESISRIGGGQVRSEIGLVAWQHSFLARWTHGCFQALASSLELSDVRRQRHAAANPSTQASNSDAVSSTPTIGTENETKEAPAPIETGTASSAAS